VVLATTVGNSNITDVDVDVGGQQVEVEAESDQIAQAVDQALSHAIRQRQIGIPSTPRPEVRYNLLDKSVMPRVSFPRTSQSSSAATGTGSIHPRVGPSPLQQIDQEIEEFERKLAAGVIDAEGKMIETQTKPPKATKPKPGEVDEHGHLVQQAGLPEFVFPGICMRDVARDIGMTAGGVSRMFNGLRIARLVNLKSIANLYCEGKVEQVVAVIRGRVIRDIKRNDSRNIKDPNREMKLRVLAAYEAKYKYAYGGGHGRR
jgi:hypothetical protein